MAGGDPGTGKVFVSDIFLIPAFGTHVVNVSTPIIDDEQHTDRGRHDSSASGHPVPFRVRSHGGANRACHVVQFRRCSAGVPDPRRKSMW